MNPIYSILSKELVEATGWTLFHSVWQGAVFALLLFVVLHFFKKMSARIRYILALGTMFFLFSAAVVTFIRVYHKTVEKAELANAIKANPRMVVENFRKALQEKSDTQKAWISPAVKIKWVVFKSDFQRNFPLVFSIWFIGILFLMIRFAGGLIYTRRLRYRNVAPLPVKWEKMVADLTDRFHLNHNLKVLQSLATKIPLTLGYFKPVILLPASLLTGLPAGQIENIIAHEMAHIRRHDYLFNIIQSVIEILFFYHPAVWWISSVVRTEREHCCDDIAIEVTGDSLSFAKALTTVQEKIIQPEESFAMAFSGNKNQLFNRIKRILTKPAMKNNINEKLIASCVVFAGFILLTVSTAFTSGNEANISHGTFHLSSGFNLVSPSDTIKDSVITGSEQSMDRLTEEKIKEVYSNLENLDTEHEQLLKDLEVMLSDLNDPVNREILAGIQAALEELDIDAIVSEAMKGAEAAMNEMDINEIVRESLNEAQNEDMDKITAEALKGAAAALDTININLIVSEALKAAGTVLSEIDLGTIIEESLKLNEDALDNLDIQLQNLDLQLENLDEQLQNLERTEDVDSEKTKNEIRKEVTKKKTYENPNAEKYTSILSEGTRAWNTWRSENRNMIPDLSGIPLSEINLQEIDFSDLSLSGSRLSKVDAGNANFSGCNAKDLVMNESTAKGADFKNATLIRSKFKMTGLIKSNFRNANLSETLFEDCNLTGADFRDANLRGVVFKGGVLDKANFKGAVANGSTRFPEGFDLEKAGIRME